MLLFCIITAFHRLHHIMIAQEIDGFEEFQQGLLGYCHPGLLIARCQLLT
jgi:hypothetical protein